MGICLEITKGISLEIMGISLEITMGIHMDIAMGSPHGDCHGGSPWRLLWGSHGYMG